jgi:hypothetical protein
MSGATFGLDIFFIIGTPIKNNWAVLPYFPLPFSLLSQSVIDIAKMVLEKSCIIGNIYHYNIPFSVFRQGINALH